MFQFTSQFIPRDVVVVGAGGTGSRLIPLLAQFMRSITRGVNAIGWVESPRIWLIDADVVEAKNLTRQNFAKNDIGKFKAQVLAERYSRAYDINIYPITEWVKSDSESVIKLTTSFQDILTAESLRQSNDTNNRRDVEDARIVMGNAVVISCVDSVQARRAILNNFAGLQHLRGQGIPEQTPIYIDAGNEDSFGQVQYFNPVLLVEKSNLLNNEIHKNVPKLISTVHPVGYIPLPLEYYLGLTDTVSTASCADLAQTLAINAIMATTIMGIVQNYFYRKSMNYHSVSISLDGGNFTTYNSYINLTGMAVATNELNRKYDVGHMENIKIDEKDKSKSTMYFLGNVYKATALSYVKPLHTAIEVTIREKLAEEERKIQLQRFEEIRAERAVRLAEMARQKQLTEEKEAAEKAKISQRKLKEELKAKHGTPEVVAGSVAVVDGQLVDATVDPVSTVASTPGGELVAPPLKPIPKKPKATSKNKVVTPDVNVAPPAAVVPALEPLARRVEVLPLPIAS